MVGKVLWRLRREILSGTFAEAHHAVTELQALFRTSHRVRSARLAVSRAVKRLSLVAKKKRRTILKSHSVDEAKVLALGEAIARKAFDAMPPPILELKFEPGSTATPMSASFFEDRKRYLDQLGSGPETGLVDSTGTWVREHLLAWSFGKLVSDLGLKPVSRAEIRKNYAASRPGMQGYVTAIASECSSHRAAGKEPVVLVGRSAARTLLVAYRCIDAGQCPPPAGVVVSPGQSDKGEPTISLINGVPVLEFETPSGDCYVLPRTMLRTLKLSGSDASSAISISWSEEGDDRLKFTLTWRAGFAPIP